MAPRVPNQSTVFCSCHTSIYSIALFRGLEFGIGPHMNLTLRRSGLLLKVVTVLLLEPQVFLIRVFGGSKHEFGVETITSVSHYDCQS